MNNKRIKVYRASQNHLVKEGMIVNFYISKFCRPDHVKQKGKGHKFIKNKFLLRIDYLTITAETNMTFKRFGRDNYRCEYIEEDGASNFQVEFFEIMEVSK